MRIESKLPDVGVTIFTVMTRLANEHGAINLSQGFPDFDCAPELSAALAAASAGGHNQYAPMAGVPALAEAVSDKIARLYGHRYDSATEITVTAGGPRGCSARWPPSFAPATKSCSSSRATTATCRLSACAAGRRSS